MKKVSIITVNYKQVQTTCEFLSSLEMSRRDIFEVIVVDNEGTVDSFSSYEKAYPGIRVICSKENLGFAGGNNLGIREAKGDFLFFLNNDTLLPEGTIPTLLKNFENTEVGAVSPKIIFEGTGGMVQFAGFSKIHPVLGRNHSPGKFQMDLDLNIQTGETAYLHGAAMMVRKEVIQKVGMMPEDYFLYFEELAWSQNIKNAGFKLLVDTEANIQHKESISIGKISPVRSYYMTRNRLIFMKNYNKPLHHLAFMIYHSLLVVPKNIFSMIFEKEFRLIKPFLQGALDGLFYKTGQKKFI